MKTMTCIIAEDEKPAQRLLASYIERIPGLELLATCSNALEAMQFLQQNPVDLIFLDLNMPGMTGLEFLESLDSKPAVIITTAYRQYALEGFEHGVTDYLLKPFSFQRFCKAIGRFSNIGHKNFSKSGPDGSLFTMQTDPVVLNTEAGGVKIDPGDIQYIESLGNYIKINTLHQRYILRETLSGFLFKLPPSHFLRVHRSYVVAVAHIESFSGNSLQIGSRSIPVGNVYKADLREVLGLE